MFAVVEVEQALDVGLHAFANGLEHDLAAVTAGLTLPWSSGQVEGHVNRIKTLKRQMYGRANFAAPQTRPTRFLTPNARFRSSPEGLPGQLDESEICLTEVLIRSIVLEALVTHIASEDVLKHPLQVQP